MDKSVDDFSKNLARGMSGRRAFWKLLAGASGLGILSWLTPKASAAPTPTNCVSLCLNVASEEYDRCMIYGGSFNHCFYDVLGAAYTCCIQRCEKGGPTKCAVNGTALISY